MRHALIQNVFTQTFTKTLNSKILSLSTTALFVASCTVTPQPPTQQPTQSPIPPRQTMPQTVLQPPIQTPKSAPQKNTTFRHDVGIPNNTTQPSNTKQNSIKPRYHSFYDWKMDFIKRAKASGVNHYVLENLLANATYNERVVSFDRNQAEFVKMPWEYIDSAVSLNRINQGKRQYANHRDILLQAESRYGVPASIITAIWGMESSFGQGMGKASLVDSLATLAYDGRRQDFAENQLIALVTLLQRGDLQSFQLQGSWAGGMGHTQFIPQTWLDESVDGDNDGYKSPFNQADALTSTASYLANAGWVRGLNPFYEVRLPANFDYRQLNSKKTIAQWQALGLYSIHGHALPSHESAQLWLPAGSNGPALLTTRNFDAIRVYNNSSNYALGVSLLAKQIIGKSGLQADFPRYEQPLSGYQVHQLQERLTSLGYDTKGIDGILGNNTRMAFWQWQLANNQNNQAADGFISQRSVSELLYRQF
ncbi:putative lytic murein transglycosylase [Moraxella macacae 0408225]|uniref:Putative lytic murein transglycosylase n=1 Tax=Moraxella macacae 0408225 TaxID=1230338 RepID=L2F5F0_9GAMM|nr:lytic murein transglycosylase [Moraxella macacae]ELA08252.1 putative lytic murein transglycosylase [Moraxella macacae 0408225]